MKYAGYTIMIHMVSELMVYLVRNTHYDKTHNYVILKICLVKIRKKNSSKVGVAGERETKSFVKRVH